MSEGVEAGLLGHPASPTPEAAVTLSRQQPYTDRLQWRGAASSGRDVAERAGEAVREGRWEMVRGEEEEHQHLSDYIGGGGEEGLAWARLGGIRQHNLSATCNFLPTMRLA